MRRPECRFYRECLDVAARIDGTMDCCRCDRFKASELETLEAEMPGLIRLFDVIVHPENRDFWLASTE
ncbi:hypothetical protein [Desulfatirhabdium butyrativorans]|uniref:hypothetical protein n=1 Tax=Desulfatirhabdium butyrativorans TaxID=340467 RepID=UPI00041CB0E0|nr:hypothetical protein [Desulfatirhabdium butyrativorans]